MIMVVKALTVAFFICFIILTVLSIFCTCVIGFNDTERGWEKIVNSIGAITIVCGVIDLIVLLGFMIFALVAS